MYEAQTYEAILARMLQKALSINSNLDTREGSLVWYGDAPAAVELQNLYIALDTILQETFADTASRPYLILRAAERGLSPEPATPAILQLSITPVSLELPLNTRFSIGELNYYVSKNLGGGNYEITCETPGEAGNNYGGNVIPIEYVAGLETCVVSSLLVPGEDDEDTEVFRTRYFNSLTYQAFGGNRQDYLNKIKAVPGVGGAKVYRVWNGNIKPAELKPPTETEAWINGLTNVPEAVKSWLISVYNAANNNLLTVGGTVKAVIISSNYTVPSSTLINNVQTIIDPTQNTGEGVGLAPIGHVVQIAGVTSQAVNLSFELTYNTGYSWDNVSAAVTEAVNGYFHDLAENWEGQEGSLIVRISQIETRVLDVDGIVDIGNTTINGVAANFTLPLDVIPALGTITAV